MQREIGGNIPLSEESLRIEPTNREIFGCNKFKYLMQKNIFCTIHWSPSSYIEGMEETKTIFPEIISLVCDQRYDLDDMENFVATINKFQQ